MTAKSTSMRFGLRIGVPRDKDLDKQQAFEHLIEGCWNMLWRYAIRTTGNSHDAEDLLSETLLEGYRSFEQFRGTTPFVRWMLRIMTTTRIDMVRKSDRRPASSLDQWIETGETGNARSIYGREETDPAKRAHDLTLSEDLQAALDSLSEDFRQVVVLCDVLEFDYTEAANILKIPIGTVRSRLHRARGQIRSAWTRLQSEGHS